MFLDYYFKIMDYLKLLPNSVKILRIIFKIGNISKILSQTICICRVNETKEELVR